jgi:hypothetical protein
MLQNRRRVRRITSNNIYVLSDSGRKLQSRRGAAKVAEILKVTKLLGANQLWDMGFKGMAFASRYLFCIFMNRSSNVSIPVITMYLFQDKV